MKAMKQQISEFQYQTINSSLKRRDLFNSQVQLKKKFEANLLELPHRRYESWSIQAKQKIIKNQIQNSTFIECEKYPSQARKKQCQQNIFWVGFEQSSHYLALAHIIFQQLYSPQLCEDKATLLKYQIYELAKIFLSQAEKSYFVSCICLLEYESEGFSKFIRKFKYFQSICLKIFYGCYSQKNEKYNENGLNQNHEVYQKIKNLRRIVQKINQESHSTALGNAQDIITISQNLWNPLNQGDDDFIVSVKLFDQPSSYLLSEKGCIFIHSLYKNTDRRKPFCCKKKTQLKKSLHAFGQNKKSLDSYNSIPGFYSYTNRQMAEQDLNLLNNILNQSLCRTQSHKQRQTECTETILNDISSSKITFDLCHNKNQVFSDNSSEKTFTNKINKILTANPQNIIESLQTSVLNSEEFEEKELSLDNENLVNSGNFSFGNAQIKQIEENEYHSIFYFPNSKSNSQKQILIIPKSASNSPRKNEKIPQFLKRRQFLEK